MKSDATASAYIRTATCVFLLLLIQPCLVIAQATEDLGAPLTPATFSGQSGQIASLDKVDPTPTAPAVGTAASRQEVALLFSPRDAVSEGLLQAGEERSRFNNYADKENRLDTAETTARRPQKDWTWRRANLAELAGISIAAGVTLYSEVAYGDPRRPNWTAHNGFDDGIRNGLRLHNRSAQDAAGSIGDGLMGLLIAEPIVDSFYTLGYRDRNWDVLKQTTVINLESFTFTALVSSVLQNSIKREKPFVRVCPDGSCSNEQPNRGMPSGHVAFALTGAGLYCTHHKYQSLYDPATERAICVTSLGLAAVDGVVRIMADRHYATDVIAGSAIGLFSGFLLPRLLHYYWSDNEAETNRSKSKNGDSFLKRVSLSPQMLSGGGIINCDIRF